jgi:hypothetical protein
MLVAMTVASFQEIGPMANREEYLGAQISEALGG